MSDTQRTDLLDAGIAKRPSYDKYCAMKRRAEQYERELNAAITERNQLRHDIDAYRRQCERDEARIKLLTSRLRECGEDLDEL